MRRHGSEAVDLLWRFSLPLIAITLLITGSVFAGDSPRAQIAPSPGNTAVSAALGSSVGAGLTQRLPLFPLAFERNEGQAEAGAKYLSHGDRYTLLLGEGKAVLSVGSGSILERIEIRLLGADQKAPISGQDVLPTKVNYLIGNDRSRWRTNVSTFGKVQYRQVYPGIDLVYYGRQGQLEHDFVVAPNADPARIRLEISGARKMAVDGNGDLVLYASSGEMRLLQPRAYQVIGGQQKEVSAKFRLRGRRVGFEVGPYDHSAALMIDPVLNWNTYLYSAVTDSTAATAIAIDGNKNVFVAGTTTAATQFDSITKTTCATCGAASGTKVFIARIDNLVGGGAPGTGADVSGSTLTWLTFIGGSRSDTASAMISDSTYLYVVGQTTSNTNGSNGDGNFPVSTTTFQNNAVTNHANSAGFVVKIPKDLGNAVAYGSVIGEQGVSIHAAATTVAISGGQLYVAGWLIGGGSNDHLLNRDPDSYQTGYKGDKAGFFVQIDPTVNGSTALVYGTPIQANDAASGSSLAVNALGLDSVPFPNWSPATAYAVGDRIMPSNTGKNPGGYVFKCTTAGTSDSPNSRYPTFPQTPGQTVTDAGVVWTNVGQPPAGNVYLAGSAVGKLPAIGACPNGSAVNGTAGFVLRLDMSKGGCGALGTSTAGYVTTLGGGTSTVTSVNGMVLDSSAGNPSSAYVTGSTSSTNTATLAVGITGAWTRSTGLSDSASCSGCGDAFVAKINTTGGIAWSGYLGGDFAERGNAIAMDSSTNNIVVVGSTMTPQPPSPVTNAFPVLNSGSNTLRGPQDAFAVILDNHTTPSKPAMVYSSYYGGSGTEAGNAVAVVNGLANTSTTAYFAGITRSSTASSGTGLPVNSVAFQAAPTSAFGTGATKTIDSLANSGFVVASNVATITTTSAHGFSVGQLVTTDGNADASFNSTCTINAVTSTTAFTCPFTHADVTTGGGTVAPSNTGGFAGVLSFANVTPTTAMSMSGSADVTGIGYGASGTPINYTFAITPGTTNSAVTFDAPVPVDGSGVARLAFSAASAVLHSDGTTAAGSCKYGARGVTCQWATLTQGVAVDVKIAAAATNADACTTVPNCGTFGFTGTVNSAELANSASATVNITILPTANVSIAQDTVPATVHVGGTGTVTYTVNVTNASGGVAITQPDNTVVVTDTLPQGFVVESYTSAKFGCTPAAPTTPGATGTVVTCTSTADIPADDSVNAIAIAGHFDATVTDLSPGGSKSVSNGAAVALQGGFLNSNSTPSSTSGSTTVTRSQEITVAIASTPVADSTVALNNTDDSIVYTFTVTTLNNSSHNDGAVNLILTPTLPALPTTFTPTSSAVGNLFTGGVDTTAPPAGSCTLSGCSITSMPKDSQFVYTLRGKYTEADGLTSSTNSATATMNATAMAQVTDTPAITPLAGVNLTVQRQANLQLAALTDHDGSGNPRGGLTTANPASMTQGLFVAAPITNGGPNNATGLQVKYTVNLTGTQVFTDTGSGPDANNNISAANKAAGCTATGRVVTCPLPSGGALPAAGGSNTTSYSLNLIPDASWIAAGAKSGSIDVYAQVISTGVWDNGTSGAPGDDNCSPAQTAGECATGPVTPVYTSFYVARRADLAVDVFTQNSSATDPVALNDATRPLMFDVTLSNNNVSYPDDAHDVTVKIALPATLADGVTATDALGYSIIANPSGTAFPNGCAITQSGGVNTLELVCGGSGFPLAHGATTPTYRVSLKPSGSWIHSTSGSRTNKGQLGVPSTTSVSAEISSATVWDDGSANDGSAGTNNSKNGLNPVVANRSNLQITYSDNTQAGSGIPLALIAADPVAPGLKLSATITNTGPDASPVGGDDAGTLYGTLLTFTLDPATDVNAPLHVAGTQDADYPTGGCAIDTVAKVITCNTTGDTIAGNGGNKTYSVTLVPGNWVAATAATGTVHSYAHVASNLVWDDNMANDGTAGDNNNSPLQQAGAGCLPSGTAPCYLASKFARTARVFLATALTTNANDSNNRQPLANALTFRTDLQNTGPDPANGTQVTFVLPSGVKTYTALDKGSYDSCTPAVVGNDHLEVTCSAGNLAAPFGPTTYAFSITPNTTWIPSGSTADVNNTATLSALYVGNLLSPPVGPPAGVLTSAATSYLHRASDLYVEPMSDNSGGNPLSITTQDLILTVPFGNQAISPDDATGVNVTITLTPPNAGTNYSVVGTTFANGCVPDTGGGILKVVCGGAGFDLAKSASATSHTVTIKPDPAWIGTGPSGVVTSTVKIDSLNVVDPDSGNNDTSNAVRFPTGTLSTTFERRADLQIVNLADTRDYLAQGPVPLTGANMQLTATVHNAGPDPATGAKVNFILQPASGTSGYTVGAFSPSCSSVQQVGLTVTCALASTLLVGDANDVIVTVNLQPDANWIQSGNQVTVTSNGTVSSVEVDDPSLTNNNWTGSGHSAASSKVARRADLQVTLSDNSQTTPVSIADTAHPLTFTVQVDNTNAAGFPDTATGVTFAINLKAGTDSGYTIGSPSPAGCSKSGLTILCDVTADSISPGTNKVYTVSVNPSSAWVSATAKTGTVFSEASVASSAVYDNGGSGFGGSNNISPTWTCGTPPCYQYQSNVGRKSDLAVATGVPRNPSDNSDNTPVGRVALTGTTITVSTTITNNSTYTCNTSETCSSDDAKGVQVVYTIPTSAAAAGVLSNLVANPDPFASQFVIDTQNGKTTPCYQSPADATHAKVTCYVGSLTKGFTNTYKFAFRTDAALVAAGTPTADIVSTMTIEEQYGTDPIAGNENGSLTTYLKRGADLSLTGLTDNSTINLVPLAGPLTFSNTVYNNGPDNVQNVRVTYTLPSSGYLLDEVGHPSTYPSHCTQALGSDQIVCTIGAMTAGAPPIPYQVSVIPDLHAIGDEQKTALTANTVATIAATDAVDAYPTGTYPNSGQKPALLERRSDLSITSVPNNGAVNLSQTGATSTILLAPPVTTLGPDLVPGVITTTAGAAVTFTMPDNTWLMSGSQPSGYFPGGCTQAGADIVCYFGSDSIGVSEANNYKVSVDVPLTFTIPSGNSAQVTVNTKIAAANVNSEGTNAGADTGTIVTTVARQSDLQIGTVTDNSNSAAAGPVGLHETLTFTTPIHNAGPNDAAGVVVVYQLPSAGYRVINNGWNYAGSCSQPIGSAILTCSVGTLAKQNAGVFQTNYVSVTPDVSTNFAGAKTLNVTTQIQVKSDSVYDDGPSGGAGTNNGVVGGFQSIIARKANLAIFGTPSDNSSSTNPVPLSGPIIYSAQVQNSTTSGGDEALGVVVTFTPPSGFLLVPGSASFPSGCTQPGGALITCPIGNLAAGASTPAYTVSVTPSAGAVPNTVNCGSNCAQISTPVQVKSDNVWDNGSSGNPDGSVAADNSAAITSTIARRSDLKINSLTDNGPVGSAGPLIYTASFQNNAGDDATGLKVKFTMPSSGYLLAGTGTNGTVAFPGGCTQSPGSAIIMCDVASTMKSIANLGTALAYSMTVTPPVNVLGSNSFVDISTTAQVLSADIWDDGGSGGPGPNNSTTKVTRVNRVTHVSIQSITSTPAAGSGTYANLGDPVTYTVSVINDAQTLGGQATSAASGFIVQLSLPANFSGALDPSAPSSTNWDCTAFPSCTYTGSLASGGPADTLVIKGSYPDTAAIVLTGGRGNSGPATPTLLAGTVTNPDALNATIKPTASTDLQRAVALTATAASTPGVNGTAAVLGTNVSYHVQIDNAGPNTAYGVAVDMVLPDYLTSLSITGGAALWTCNGGNWPAVPSTSVQCTATAISGNGSAALDFQGQYSDTLTPTALTTSTTNPGFGTAPVTVTPSTALSYQTGPALTAKDASTPVQRSVNLLLTGHTPNVPPAGTYFDLSNDVANSLVAYSITLHNSGPNSATGITVKDALAGYFLAESHDPAWTCAAGAATYDCTFTGTVAPNSDVTLGIAGRYDNTVAANHIPGLTGQTTVNTIAKVYSDSSSGVIGPAAGMTASTNIERRVNLGASITPVPSALDIGTTMTWTITTSNTGPNDADQPTVKIEVPLGFIPSGAPADAGGTWNCTQFDNLSTIGLVSNVCTAATCASSCSTISPAFGVKSTNITVTGEFHSSAQSSASSVETATVTLSPGLSYNASGAVIKTGQITLVRQVNVDVNTIVAGPNPVGAATNEVGYSITTKNTGPNDVGTNGTVTVTFAPPANFTLTQPTAATPFTGCTFTGYSQNPSDCRCVVSGSNVACSYSGQPKDATATVVVKGIFDTSVVNTPTLSGTGTASAQLAATNVNNNAASPTVGGSTVAKSADVTVVNTAASPGAPNCGANCKIQPQNTANGNPILVTYDNVNVAGVTSQLALGNSIPGGVPAINPPQGDPGVDYSSTNPQYVYISTPAAARVQYSGQVEVCVTYAQLAAFAKTERLRLFQYDGTTGIAGDITTVLNSSTGVLCGKTAATPATNVSPGLFTVREPVNHLPVPKAVAIADPSVARGQTASRFSLSAKGSSDADVYTRCISSAGGCSDRLWFQWSINGDTSKVPLIGPINPDAGLSTYSPADTPLIQFNLGTNTVRLTVTDYDPTTTAPPGASAQYTEIKVSVSSFTLSATNDNAIISAGQTATYQVSGTGAPPFPAGAVSMSMSCDGVRISPPDGMTLAQAHITCVVSPTLLTHDQYATVLVTTTGPTFSRLLPALPGSRGRVLAAWMLGLATLPAFGLLLLPGTRRNGRKWVLLLILGGLLAAMVACGGGGGTPPAAQQVSASASTPAGVYRITVSGTFKDAAGNTVGTFPALTPPYTLTVK